MLTVWAALGESGSLQSVLSCSPEWSGRVGGGVRLGGERGCMGEEEMGRGVETGGELDSSSKRQNATVGWGVSWGGAAIANRAQGAVAGCGCVPE